MANLTKLHLIDSEEPTRREIALAEIEQAMREYHSPHADVSGQGWQPIEAKAANPLPTDAIQQRSYKVIVADSPVPLWRRILRWRKQG